MPHISLLMPQNRGYAELINRNIRTDKMGRPVELLKRPLLAFISGESAAIICESSDCDPAPGACVGPVPTEPGVVEGVKITGSVGTSHCDLPVARCT